MQSGVVVVVVSAVGLVSCWYGRWCFLGCVYQWGAAAAAAAAAAVVGAAAVGAVGGRVRYCSVGVVCCRRRGAGVSLAVEQSIA